MIHPLYLDFFKFLDQMSENDAWPSYERLYLTPHEKFFLAYWKNFAHFDRAQIAERVRRIKKGDYGQLRSLVRLQDPALLAEESLEKCRRIFSFQPEPPVYLFVGFFSVDGATVEVEGFPSIALGLERFRDFKDLPLLLAHEYCHCAQRVLLQDRFSPGDASLHFKIVSEGLSVFFSQLVYPDLPLHRHLFLTPERLRWARENEAALLELAAADLAEEKLVPVLFGAGDPRAGLPPRLGYFLAREMVGHCLSHHGAEDFGQNFPGFENMFRKILDCRLTASAKEE